MDFDGARLLILKNEITNDPLTRGYSGMTDPQIADSLNTSNRSVTVPTLTGRQIGAAIDLTEFDARTAAQQNTIRAMWPLDDIPTEAGFYREFILATFNAQSTTRANILAKFTRTSTRAAELGLPFVGAHHVAEAKALS
jgi:hypothetical protein